MRAFKTMIKTELKLSLRGMDMFIFAICAPLVVLVLLGILYGDKPAFEGAGYTFLEQSFGALTTISICAGGVMGLPLVVSEYRSHSETLPGDPRQPGRDPSGPGLHLHPVRGRFPGLPVPDRGSVLWIPI